VEAIRAVARGEVHVDPRIGGYLVGRFREPAAPTTPVTDDELKLVRTIADGFSTVELAAHLCVFERAKNLRLPSEGRARRVEPRRLIPKPPSSAG
jgi:DNA-binding NarL/FixJ family response regulator